MTINAAYILVLVFSFIVTILEILLTRHIFPNGKKDLQQTNNDVFLYSRNGAKINKVKITDVGKKQEVTLGKDICTLETLVKCNINEGIFTCSSCSGLLSSCVHFDTDVPDVNAPKGIIPANSNADEGYCLPLIDDRNNRKCTAKNGGKWVLTANNDKTRYSFICVCTKDRFFNKLLHESNCDMFMGCKNGKLENTSEWEKFTDMKCACPDNYKPIDGTNIYPPQCIEQNMFQWNESSTPFNILDTKYIAPEYLELLQDIKKVSLPDPCNFDVATRTHLDGIGIVKIEPTLNVAYCESIDNRYTEIIMTDDYLLNNQGRYANALIRIVTDTKDPIKYDRDIVYEFLRKPKGQADEPLEGRRILYSQFLLRLPYYEVGSNVTQQINDINYHYQPRMKKLNSELKVFVFRAPKPIRVKLKIANTMEWVPAFQSTSFLTSYRVFNGVLPILNMPRNTFPNTVAAIYPTPPAYCATKFLGTKGLLGNIQSPDVNDLKINRFFAMPLFLRDDYINPYTRLFTGLIVTYFMPNRNNLGIKVEKELGGNQFFTKPLSPFDITLCALYRKNYDKNWKDLPSGKLKQVSHDCLSNIAINDRDEHFFAENAVTYEINGLGVATKLAGNYEFDQNNKPVYAKYYK